MAVMQRPSSGCGWRLSALLVGLLALVVTAVTTAVLDSESLAIPLVVGVAFIGVATVILVPRTKSRRHHNRPRSTVQR